MASTTHASQRAPGERSTRTTRLGVVSFLNTVPLIDGLDGLQDVTIRHSVPSLLIDQLIDDEVDVALCSSIDYVRAPQPLVILPAGLLGCDGPTLTVRLYSAKPIEETTRVHCDTDSHTSVVLMRILLAEMYGLQPEIVAYDAREHVAENRPIEWPETVLLIGDKVVTDASPAIRYPHHLDLGDAWKRHTNLPFVFAMWLAAPSMDRSRLETINAILDRQRRLNASRLETIVHDHAPRHRWPIDLAAHYIQECLDYGFTPQHVEALTLFYEKAFQGGFIDRHREVAFLGSGEAT